jgi:hypothetical protein
LIQVKKEKSIVYLSFFIMLIMCLAYISTPNSTMVEGKQHVPAKFSVRITYPPPRQQVPIGSTLTIFGTATDSGDCTVYANSSTTKFQKVVGVGPAGNNDYTSWIFSYPQNYPVVEGINRLAAKLSCKANPINFTSYYTTNVTGITDKNKINNFSELESSVHIDNNTDKYSNALAGSGNNRNSYKNPYNPPFWFPNLFHGDIGDLNHGSKAIQLPQESGKVLGISIKVGKNPIAWNDEQIIKITVYDPDSKQPIPNAIVTGAITFPGLNTGTTSFFTKTTDNLGTTSYSWFIADKNAKAGVYDLKIYASAYGYNTNSALSSFAVMPVSLSAEKGISNDNKLHRSTPSISTLHAGLAG